MKHTTRPQSYRLRRILDFIRTGMERGAYANARTMARELEVSWHTIIRDLEVLRDDEGAPIEYDASRKGYFLSKRGWSLRPVRLTAREAETLAMAARMFQPFRGTPLEKDLYSLFEKIGLAMEGGVSIPFGRDNDPVSFIPDDYVPIDPQRWTEAVRLARNRTPVRMTYTTFRGDLRSYEVTPVHLFAYHGNWYWAGFKRGTTKAVTFAVSRIRDLKPLAEAGWAPSTFDPRVYMRSAYGIAGGEEPIRVRVRVSPSIAAYMTERVWHPTQRIRQRRDGSAEIAFTTRGRKEVVRWVLSWQPDMVVVSPASLRQRVREKMAAGLNPKSGANEPRITRIAPMGTKG